jgi:hypothetical protein
MVGCRGVNSSSKTSVVIPTYNGIKHIPPCLDSLRRQSRRPDEVIAVDDGSTDGTDALIRRAYPEVQLVRLEKNKGFAAAVNEGIVRSSGRYIALLNNDTQAHPDWLLELTRVLDEQPSIGFCSSKMLFADQPGVINSIGIGFTRSGIAMDVGYRQKDGAQFNQPRLIFGACAGAAIYRRSLFDELGRFDEGLFMWYEDADFSFRAQLAGYHCLYVPTAVVYHKGGGTISSTGKKHIYYCSRNQILILAKNLPRSLLPRYMLRMFSVCVKHSVKSLLNGETAAFSGYCAAVGGLKQFLRKGSLMSSKTITSDEDILDLLLLDTENIAGASAGVDPIG